MVGKSSQSRRESEKAKKKEGGGKTAFFLAIFMLVLALAGKYYIMKLARGDNSSKSAVHSAHAATPTTHRHTLQLTIPLVLSSRSVCSSPEITHNRADS